MKPIRLRQSFSPTQGLWLLATLLLLAVFGYRVQLMWPQPPHMPALPLPAIAPDVPRLDSAALANLHLFKPAQATGPSAFRVDAIDVASPQLRNAPLSLLDARLTGVLSGPQGIAVVEYAKRQNSYVAGDTLADQAKIVRIFSDRIIISRQGQYEALALH